MWYIIFLNCVPYTPTPVFLNCAPAIPKTNFFDSTTCEANAPPVAKCVDIRPRPGGGSDPTGEVGGQPLGFRGVHAQPCTRREASPS